MADKEETGKQPASTATEAIKWVVECLLTPIFCGLNELTEADFSRVNQDIADIAKEASSEEPVQGKLLGRLLYLEKHIFALSYLLGCQNDVLEVEVVKMIKQDETTMRQLREKSSQSLTLQNRIYYLDQFLHLMLAERFSEPSSAIFEIREDFTVWLIQPEEEEL